MSIKYSHSFPGYNKQVTEAAAEALSKGFFSGRLMKAQAEQQLQQRTNAGYVKLVGSGFSALQAALIAFDRVEGNRGVIIPSICCPSVYHAVRSAGLQPIVIDVEEHQPLIQMEHAIDLCETGFASVVIVPQMFGLRKHIESYRLHDIRIIEDLAQSFIHQFNENSDVAICSFSPTKLFTSGYGGAVITNNSELGKRISVILDVDHNEYALIEEADYQYRIHAPFSDYQAAMLITQLERYQEIISYRNMLITEYDRQLGFPTRLLPEVPFRYQIILEQANAEYIAQQLRDKGIGAWALGAQLLHYVFGIKGEFPNSEKWKTQLLSLPIHENLSVNDVIEISRVVKPLL